MFMPCPNCGFLVALIAGREMSQRCPRCGSALLSEGDLIETPQPTDAGRTEEAPARDDATAAEPAELVPPPREAVTPAPRVVERVELRTPEAEDTVVDAAIETNAGVETQTDFDYASDDTDDDDAVAPSDASASAAPRVTQDGPSFVRRRAARPRGRRWPLIAIVATLAVVFGLQLLLAQRVALAADARWRPLVLQTCGVLRCEVPAWREPQAYRMLTRNVRPNPARPGVLHVTATVRNDARWPQPAPVIVLSLSDLDGRLVGARAVAPREYGQRVAALVAPGDSLDVAFDVREPAHRVESYDFQLQ